MYSVSHGLRNIGLWITCAWMVGSTVPRSMEGKKRITRMATKIARLVALGLLFVGLYEGFVILEEDTRPGPPAVLDHCSLHSSDQCHVEENVAALGHWLTSVLQPQE